MQFFLKIILLFPCGFHIMISLISPSLCICPLPLQQPPKIKQNKIHKEKKRNENLIMEAEV